MSIEVGDSMFRGFIHPRYNNNRFLNELTHISTGFSLSPRYSVRKNLKPSKNKLYFNVLRTSLNKICLGTIFRTFECDRPFVYVLKSND